MNSLHVLFAGGGTGGHLAPGLAVAEEIRRRCPHAAILFVGTDKPLERTMVERAGFPYAAIHQRPMNRSPLKLPVWGVSMLRAVARSHRLTRGFEPDVVVGLGGYGCVGPTVAAALRGRPLVLLEQNVIPGRATRLLARWSQYVCCQFGETLPRLKGARALWTGNPVRQGIGTPDVRHARESFGLAVDRRTLLVMGGSQGAAALNDAMISAAPELAPRASAFQVIHLTGQEKSTHLREVYERHGIRASVFEFSDDMANIYAASDLALSRAGATSMAEMAIAGVPMVLVPYPFAAENHQEYNAATFADRGAAVLLRQNELTAYTLLSTLNKTLWDDERLGTLRRNVRALARPDAVRVVTDHVLAAAMLQQAGALRHAPQHCDGTFKRTELAIQK